MNAAEKTLDWLYKEQLHIDEEWSLRTSKGFTWWADNNAQSIEIIGTEAAEDGDTNYLIKVQTDFLQRLKPSPKVYGSLNVLLMCNASMAGPVYDEKAGTLKLCSTVRVYERIRPWMSTLISMACVLQVAEARIMMNELAELLNAEPATSGHPKNGVRAIPDELAEVVRYVVAPLGQKPCMWTNREFEEVVEEYMQKPPSLLSTNGGLGFTVEFPYGEFSSLCRAKGDEPHPRYGNGLLVRQSFPVIVSSESEGIRLALSLNQQCLTKNPFGYGFGSYCYLNDCIHFITFFPNAAYAEGLLPNIYFAAIQRARAMSARLANEEWTAELFDRAFSNKQKLIEHLFGKHGPEH
jgi:hypothetical protein